MEDVPQSIRHDAATLARRKRARSTRFSRDAPCEWRPMTVINLEDGNPFTPEAAWEFVAEKLEDQTQEAYWVELKKLPGKRAIAMRIASGDREIYVKVQLGSGTIHGRSFHYSTY